MTPFTRRLKSSGTREVREEAPRIWRIWRIFEDLESAESAFLLGVSAQCLDRQVLELTAGERAFVGEYSGAGPVGALPDVGEWLPFFHERHGELVDKMRMTATVPGALGEG